MTKSKKRSARFADEPRMSPASEQATSSLSQPLIQSAPSELPSPFAAAADQPLERQAGGVFRDKHGKYRTLYDQRARTTVLVNLAGILERR